MLPLVTPAMTEPKVKGLNFKEARIYILEQVIEMLHKKATEHSSYRYSNVIKEYLDKLAFLKSVENEDENSTELERLQKIAFDEESKTLNMLVREGDITSNMLDNYMRYAERTQVFKQASLIQRVKVELSTFVLKLRLRRRIKTNAASPLAIVDNLNEIAKMMRIVHYHVVRRLNEETTEDNKLEVGMICDSYLMRIDNLTPANFLNQAYQDHLTKIKLNALKEQRRILAELLEEGEITETTALKIREAINYDEMVVVDRVT